MPAAIEQELPDHREVADRGAEAALWGEQRAVRAQLISIQLAIRAAAENGAGRARALKVVECDVAIGTAEAGIGNRYLFPTGRRAKNR